MLSQWQPENNRFTDSHDRSVIWTGFPETFATSCMCFNGRSVMVWFQRKQCCWCAPVVCYDGIKQAALYPGSELGIWCTGLRRKGTASCILRSLRLEADEVWRPANGRPRNKWCCGDPWYITVVSNDAGVVIKIDSGWKYHQAKQPAIIGSSITLMSEGIHYDQVTISKWASRHFMRFTIALSVSDCLLIRRPPTILHFIFSGDPCLSALYRRPESVTRMCGMFHPSIKVSAQPVSFHTVYPPAVRPEWRGAPRLKKTITQPTHRLPSDEMMKHVLYLDTWLIKSVCNKSRCTVSAVE